MYVHTHTHSIYTHAAQNYVNIIIFFYFALFCDIVFVVYLKSVWIVLQIAAYLIPEILLKLSHINF